MPPPSAFLIEIIVTFRTCIYVIHGHYLGFDRTFLDYFTHISGEYGEDLKIITILLISFSVT
jgi:hypothetical protein